MTVRTAAGVPHTCGWRCRRTSLPPAGKPSYHFGRHAKAIHSGGQQARGRPPRNPGGVAFAAAGGHCAQPIDFTIRAAKNEEELHACAVLRIDVFYEGGSESEKAKAIDMEMLWLNTLFKAAAAPSRKMKSRLECVMALAAKHALSPEHSINPDLILGSPESSEQVLLGTLDIVDLLPSERNSQYSALRLSIDNMSSAAYMANVCVHPAARRQAVGSQLVGYAQGMAALWDVDMLWTEVEASNAAALRMYEESGFEVVRPEGYKTSPEDILLLQDTSLSN